MIVPIQRKALPHWKCYQAEEKLRWRSKLPGASVYDHVSLQLHQFQEQGIPLFDLLPMALSNSWLVNNQLTSVDFLQLLLPQKQETWKRLLFLLQGPTSSWQEKTQEQREEIVQCIDLLLPQKPIVAITKILALLCPQTVPLMDDAAIWFALRAISYPQTAEKSVATSSFFLPMMDWFTSEVCKQEEQLSRLAEWLTETGVTTGKLLLPAQVLDRLVWFESWGFHLCRTPLWRWFQGDRFEGIIQTEHIPTEKRNPAAKIDLETTPQLKSTMIDLFQKLEAAEREPISHSAPEK